MGGEERKWEVEAVSEGFFKEGVHRPMFGEGP